MTMRLSEKEEAVWERCEFNGYLRCSNCKNAYIQAEWPEDGKWNFCPNCGRKMKKEET